MNPPFVLFAGLILLLLSFVSLALSSWDKTDLPIRILGRIGLVAAFLMVVGSQGLSEKSCEHGTVAQVGGCDRDGRCGIQLINTDFSTALYPVVGDNVEYNCKTDWK